MKRLRKQIAPEIIGKVQLDPAEVIERFKKCMKVLSIEISSCLLSVFCRWELDEAVGGVFDPTNRDCWCARNICCTRQVRNFCLWGVLSTSLLSPLDMLIFMSSNPDYIRAPRAFCRSLIQFCHLGIWCWLHRRKAHPDCTVMYRCRSSSRASFFSFSSPLSMLPSASPAPRALTLSSIKSLRQLCDKREEFVLLSWIMTKNILKSLLSITITRKRSRIKKVFSRNDEVASGSVSNGSKRERYLGSCR